MSTKGFRRASVELPSPCRVFDVRRLEWVEWLPPEHVLAFNQIPHGMPGASLRYSHWPYWFTYEGSSIYRFHEDQIVRIVLEYPHCTEGEVLTVKRQMHTS